MSVGIVRGNEIPIVVKKLKHWTTMKNCQNLAKLSITYTKVIQI